MELSDGWRDIALKMHRTNTNPSLRNYKMENESTQLLSKIKFNQSEYLEKDTNESVYNYDDIQKVNDIITKYKP